MAIKITPEQREALDRCDGPVLVEDDESHRIYYLVDVPTFDSLERQKDVAAIREGIADMEAGRIVTLDELDGAHPFSAFHGIEAMNYTVIMTERAARDIEDAADWWARERSADQAQRWYQGIRAAIQRLARSPESRPIVAQSDLVSYEIRELYYGLGSKPTHRVIFTIVRQTVLVLTVRHAARGPLRPEDLA